MLIKVIFAFIAIFTFAILEEVPPKYLVVCGITGAIGWWVYLLCEDYHVGDVVSTFWSALVIAFVSQIFARKMKAPVTVFLVAGILPTVPGAGMFQTVYYLIQNERAIATIKLIQTLKMAGAIALGIFLVDTLFRVIYGGQWKWKLSGEELLK
jgi:uncharacterized membrane protein YjjB (DUF3815 family)